MLYQWEKVEINGQEAAEIKGIIISTLDAARNKGHIS